MNILFAHNLKIEDTLDKSSTTDNERLSVIIDETESIFPNKFAFDIFIRRLFV